MALGRPLELTPEIQAKICESLAAGNIREHAILTSGITVPTFYGWMKKGRAGSDPRCVEFFKAVRHAESMVACQNLAMVQKAAMERDEVVTKRVTLPDGTEKVEVTTKRVFDWQAATWWLERRFPKHYGSNRREVHDLQKRIKELEAKTTLESGDTTETAALLEMEATVGLITPAATSS